MYSNNQHTLKEIPHCLTPTNFNLNYDMKSIEYNIPYDTSSKTPKMNILPKNAKNDEDSQNLNFKSTFPSLKDQIFSPEDDDISISNNYQTNNYNNNDFDYNYYLNFTINKY